MTRSWQLSAFLHFSLDSYTINTIHRKSGDAMIQIIGTKKCKETAKALRACKERTIAFQFVDLAERELSAGEWKSLFTAHVPLSLVDSESAYYSKQGYQYRDFDAQEELIEHPALLKTPILRSGGRVHVGYDLAVITDWGAR